MREKAVKYKDVLTNVVLRSVTLILTSVTFIDVFFVIGFNFQVNEPSKAVLLTIFQELMFKNND